MLSPTGLGDDVAAQFSSCLRLLAQRLTFAIGTGQAERASVEER